MRIVSSGKPGRAVLARDFAAGDGADDAMHVADRQLGVDVLAALDRGLAQIEQLREVERLLQPVILRPLAEAAGVRADVGLVQQVAEVQALRLPVIDRLARLRADRRGRPSLRCVRKPSCAMSSRTSMAMKRMKLTTCSGLPANFSRRRGSCVAMPAGQVFRWHTRIMMQPVATSGAVAKPNSSAPSSAAIDDVAPGLELAVRLRRRCGCADCSAPASDASRRARVPTAVRRVRSKSAATHRCRRRGR